MNMALIQLNCIADRLQFNPEQAGLGTARPGTGPYTVPGPGRVLRGAGPARRHHREARLPHKTDPYMQDFRHVIAHYLQIVVLLHT